MASEFLNPLSNNDAFFRNTINDAIGNRQKAMDPIHDMNKGAFTFLTSFANAQKERELKAKLTADQLRSEEKRARDSNIMDAAKILGQVGWDVYKGRRAEGREDDKRIEDRENEVQDATTEHERALELEGLRNTPGSTSLPQDNGESVFNIPAGNPNPDNFGTGSNLDSMDFNYPSSPPLSPSSDLSGTTLSM